MLIVFPLAELRNKTPLRLGVGPSFQGAIPLPATYLTISGVTRDSSGVALPSCLVSLFRASDNLLMDQMTSDSNGVYSFSAGLGESYYVVAYLTGAPDVAGTSVDNLVGT